MLALAQMAFNTRRSWDPRLPIRVCLKDGKPSFFVVNPPDIDELCDLAV